MGNARLRLVLVGAGHGHLKTIHAIPELLKEGVKVTVVDPSPILYYSGTLAGVVSRRFSETTARIDTAAIVRSLGGTFIEGTVDRVDPDKREMALAEGSTLRWDIASFAVGSHSKISVPVETAAKATVFPLKPMYDPSLLGNAISAGTRVARGEPFRIVVVGGGATAVEIAANLEEAVSRGRIPRRPDSPKPVVELIARSDRLLPQFPRRAGEIAYNHLTRRGVAVSLGYTLTAVSAKLLRFSDGSSRGYGIVIPAFGLSIPPVFQTSPVPTGETGGLAVDECLRVPGTDLFGVGDCIDFGPRSLEKVGVHAVKQSGVLLENIRRTVFNKLADSPAVKELERYIPPSKVLQIVTLGGRNAIARRGDQVWSGCLFNSLKERIDWQYVRSGGRSIRPAIFRRHRNDLSTK